MTALSELQLIESNSPWRGFPILLEKELRTWWGKRRWLLMGLVWLLVINGLLALVLFLLPQTLESDGLSPTGDNLLSSGLQAFFGLGSMAAAVGVIVLAQDSIIGETQGGTIDWLLAQPVTRRAVILAKLVAHAWGAFVILLVLQGVVAYIQLSFVGELAFLPFIKGLAIMAIHTLFYLGLVFFLNVFSQNRGLVLGVSLASLLGGQFLLNLKATFYVTPWGLSNVAVAAATGQSLPLELFIPVLVTAGWCLFFILASFWRFERLEF